MNITLFIILRLIFRLALHTIFIAHLFAQTQTRLPDLRTNTNLVGQYQGHPVFNLLFSVFNCTSDPNFASDTVFARESNSKRCKLCDI